ncbi:MAG TPA: SIR2 family protein [Candidatus Angelobacter sp.]
MAITTVRTSTDDLEQPPYGIILNALKGGNVVPFLGAGASMLGFETGPAFPSGATLAQFLADQARFPSSDMYDRTDLAKVTSYYVDVSSRKLLRQELRNKFINQDYKCNKLHRLLARVADGTTIVTTNYDTLLEQAFKEEGKAYDLVVYPADNTEYANGVLWWSHGESEPKKLKSNEIDIEDLGKRNVIYKMHGTVWTNSAVWDSFVITEEDYVRFLSRIKNAVPSAFRRHFSTRPFLFLGYGLKDWNLRVLLREVSVSEFVSWAILKSPTALDKMLWAHRKIRLYDVDLATFVQEMEKELNLR